MIAETNAVESTNRPSITESVIECVARESGRTALELPPLWNAIDPDALDAMFEPTKAGHERSGRVQFSYCGYLVTVEADDDVTVTLESESEIDN